MTCNDTHVYLFAFLDNELESSLSIELQQHLDRCAACAREAEIERTIQKRLQAKLAPGDASAGELGVSFEAGLVEDHLIGESHADGRGRPASIGRMWFTRRRRAVLAAVIPLAAAAVWWTWSPGFGWGRGAASVRPQLAALAIADFRHFEEEGMPLQIASADRAEVAGWLREKTSIDMALPHASESRWQLTGGRKCTLDGQKAAFAVYKSDGDVASVVAVRWPVGAMQEFQRLEQHGRMLWGHRSNDCTVVAARQDDLVYVAVARLPEDRLVPLLSGANR